MIHQDIKWHWEKK